MKRIRKNLFRRGRTYYYRRQEDGRDRWISLETADLPEARNRIKQLETARLLERAGIGERKRLGKRFVHLKEVIAKFEQAGFPLRNGGNRAKQAVVSYTRGAKITTRELGNVRIDEFNASVWNGYTGRAIVNGRGRSALDKEIIVIRAAFEYCTAFPDETGITETPRFNWAKRLQLPPNVSHCRDRQPDDAEQLHKIASYFLRKPLGGATVGWLVLFQSMIGQRCSEILKLRFDASSPSEPGFDDGEHLWLYRSKTHKGTAPFIKIHPDLRELMTAHRQWVSRAYPGNPWFFPSRRGSGKRIDGPAVVQAFLRMNQELGLNKSSHGLRSYYVNVLRSQGVSDGEIALRIGHKSGGKLIVETYGEVLPIKLTWRPEGPPAWEGWTGNESIAAPKFA